MSKTPETNAEVGYFDLETAVSADFARKLERERDEAREEIRDWKRLHDAAERGVDLTIAEGTISDLRKQQDEWAAMCGRYKQERDELLNEIKRLRLDAQREAEQHDRMVKELESLYDKLKS